MKEEQREKMLNLLADRAVFGLNETELRELEQLTKNFPEFENDNSFDLAAAAFSLVDIEINEPLPANLSAKVSAAFDKSAVFDAGEREEYQKTFAVAEPKKSVWNWLGWAVAALACLVLFFNIWSSRIQPKEVGGVNPTPPVAPAATPTLAEQRAQFLASAGDVIQKNWTDFPKNPHGVTGDVVWSNSLQKGFIHFRNLPANDKTKETYQLWIGDENQEKPVDGGVFDVDQNGDVIIPIDAKLKIAKPKMFAVTVEKPGGVVVSKLGKVMAIAKIET